MKKLFIFILLALAVVYFSPVANAAGNTLQAKNKHHKHHKNAHTHTHGHHHGKAQI